MLKQTLFILVALLSFNGFSQSSLSELTLKDYRPKSVFEVPSTNIEKPAFPIIDMHSHPYAQSAEDIDLWVKTLDKIGVQKVVLLCMQTGAGFDSIVDAYAKYPNKFELWCGIDFTGYKTDKDWVKNAVAELERCHKSGAKGVGEMGDKGEGLLYSKPTAAYGLHMDDPSLKPIWQKCAELGMPVSIHIAEPIWMYEQMDSTNDGLMNAYNWKVDLTIKDILNHAELIQTLDNAVKENPKTTFIACHFANCSYDLKILGNMFDAYPNLWADNAARYAETAPIPRYVKSFYEKYQDRLLYGTDMGMDEDMYKITFRILESEDEHFYETELFNYHWPLYGFGLSDEVLEKLYKNNALLIKNLL